MSLAEERNTAIADTLSRVRAIENAQGVTRTSLAEIREQMIGLAARKDLFMVNDFALPEGKGEHFSTLSKDDDGRFALYLEVADNDVSTPPHDHTTWAVVVGITGCELNKLYEGDGGPTGEAPLKVREEVPVQAGTGVCMMPEDFHSIHIEKGTLNMHLHLYGLAFVHLKGRRMFDAETGGYRDFTTKVDA